MDWQISTLTTPITAMYVGLIRTPPDKRDPAAIETARKLVSNAFDILDRHLAKRDFVTGPNFTIGDIPAGVLAWRWFNLPIERPDQPYLRAWFDTAANAPRLSKIHRVADELRRLLDVQGLQLQRLGLQRREIPREEVGLPPRVVKAQQKRGEVVGSVDDIHQLSISAAVFSRSSSL